MTQSALSLRNVSVAFAGHKVLHDISASIPIGGYTVFVGPNGAGKTTLLLCLLGEIAYSGTIDFASELKKHIAYIPQSLHVDIQTPITVGEFLSLAITRQPLWLFGKNKSPQIEEALKQVELEGSETRLLGNLSGGERRRVFLASALLRKPRLLLLDEPAAGVDMKGERLFWELLNAIRKTTQMTIVTVSHNLSLTAHYATHVLCLYNGKCLEGSPRTVLTATNLMNTFGIPIHLYPDQCCEPHFLCPQCGAFGMKNDDTNFCALQHEGREACLLALKQGERATSMLLESSTFKTKETAHD